MIMDSGFYFLKGLLGVRKRVVYGSLLVKRGPIGPGKFMEMALTVTSGQKIYW